MYPNVGIAERALRKGEDGRKAYALLFGEDLPPATVLDAPLVGVLRAISARRNVPERCDEDAMSHIEAARSGFVGEYPDARFYTVLTAYPSFAINEVWGEYTEIVVGHDDFSSFSVFYLPPAAEWAVRYKSCGATDILASPNGVWGVMSPDFATLAAQEWEACCLTDTGVAAYNAPRSVH